MSSRDGEPESLIRASGRALGRRLRYSRSRPDRLVVSSGQVEARAAYLERIASGSWELVDRPCQLCDGRDFRVVAETDRHALPVRTVICETCALVQTCPVLRETDYRDYYANLYRPLYDAVGSPTADFFADQLARGRSLVDFLRKSGKVSTGTVVEIGVGAGGILAAFAEAGYSGFGCDFGEEFLTFGRSRGLDLRVGGIDTLPDGCADVVVYSHVLEHVYDLRRELAHVRRILKSDGSLILEVPGIFAVHRTYGADLRDYFQAAHLYYFSRRTLRNVLNSSGFDETSSNYLIQGVFRVGLEASNPASAASRRRRIGFYGTLVYLRLCVLARPVLQPLQSRVAMVLNSRSQRQ